MLRKKSPVFVMVALALVGLAACEKKVECAAAEGPYVVPDTDYDKMSHPLPRCEPKKPVELRQEPKPEQHEAEDPAPTPDQPGQPDTLGGTDIGQPDSFGGTD